MNERSAGSTDPFSRPFSPDLHALRGFAALAVFFDHYLAFLSTRPGIVWPLGFVSGGLSAVALFFIMSGVVLGISLRRFEPKVTGYVAYAVRRAARLLPMIVLTCTIGYVFSNYVKSDVVSPLLADQYYHFYQEPMSLGRLLFAFTGMYSGANPPMWSIAIEIIASALLPLMVLCSRNLRNACLVGLVFLVVAVMTSGVEHRLLPNHWTVYLVNFQLGIILCYLAAMAGDWVRRIPERVFYWLPIGLFLVLMNGRLVLDLAKHGHIAGNLFDMVIASALVILLLERRHPLGNTRVGHFLGDTSYGLYLLHWPVLSILLPASLTVWGLTALAAPEAWGATMLVVSLALLLGLAWLCYQQVERPAIELGRRLSRRIEQGYRPVARPVAAELVVPTPVEIVASSAPDGASTA